ncbi:hypothetical protein AS159_06265 [Thermotoga sp. Ku-13t]|nr:hypothetical protein AS159_06265 [Thermotoga sp. Ku-13t]
MVSVGPASVANELKRVLERFEVSDFLVQMEAFREKLDQYHRHVVLFSAGRSENFHLFVAVDHLGRRAVGLSIVNPFEKNLPIYSLKSRVEVEDVYERLFSVGPTFHRCGIVRLPFGFKMICGVGDEDFLGKEIFKEKIYGERKLSFAELVDESIYGQLLSLNNSSIDLMTVRLLDEGILCLLRAPEDVDRSHVPLLAEIAQLLKSKYRFACKAKYQSINFTSPVLASVCIEYERLFSGFDVKSFCHELSKKLMEAYWCVIKTI